VEYRKRLCPRSLPPGPPDRQAGWTCPALQLRGIRVCIPPKRRPKHWKPKPGRPIVAKPEDNAQRWKVARTIAWLGNYRRLLVRWERDIVVYQGFFTFALLLLCLNRVLT
jgi:hypothetical protein